MEKGSDNFKTVEPRLVQTQSQRLILSPQIRQYLRLLQLPLTELRTALEEEMAENPALEEISRETPEEGDTASGSEINSSDSAELRFDGPEDPLKNLDQSLAETAPFEQDLSLPEAQEIRKRKDYQESLITRRESLSDYLDWQIGLLDLSEEERKVAEEIIGNLTDDGYLFMPLEEIAQATGNPVSAVEEVLREIQTLDPPGIAARTLQESLLLQLEKKGEAAQLAQQIVREHLPLLQKKQWPQMTKRIGVSLEEVHEAARLIARLDPKPGRTFYGEDSMAIVPDAAVTYDESGDGRLQTEIYDEGIPEVRVSPYYRRLLRNPKLDEASRRFLREKLQAAIDFVRALSERQSTLRRITEEIVKAQGEFFEKGFSHLKPFRMKDIAARLSIHESTVSRALQGKYLSTPQGTIPYKSFFSSRLERVAGEAESQKSMMEKIRELIRSEDPARPLSDQEITRILQNEGIKIARRTVAKYRDLLKILPSHLRRQK